MKGQAFIIFRTLTSAVNARKALNEVELYGKPMKIHFSKMKSDVIAKQDGSYKPRQRQAPVNIKEELDKKKEEKLKLAKEKQQQQMLQQQSQNQAQQ